MLLNYIIIDLNPVQRFDLLQFFKKIKALKLKGEFSNALDANNFLNYNTIDLIFLSAKLPGFSSFEFIDKLCDPKEVILITKQPQDALRAYDHGLIDYIAPPFTFSRVEKSVKRVIIKIKALLKRKKKKVRLLKSNII